MNKFMKEAIKEAFEGIKKNDGGPFGAVIVKDGKIIARGHNEVLKTNDPSSHAEIVAIRKASAKLKKFNLSDCEIYASCEPCPMCLAAICWARIKKLHYGCTKEDAAEIGFDDSIILNMIKGTSKRQIKTVQIDREEALKPFKKWKTKKDRVIY